MVKKRKKKHYDLQFLDKVVDVAWKTDVDDVNNNTHDNQVTDQVAEVKIRDQWIKSVLSDVTSQVFLDSNIFLLHHEGEAEKRKIIYSVGNFGASNNNGNKIQGASARYELFVWNLFFSSFSFY